MKKLYFLLLTVLLAASSNAQTTLISPTGDGGFENGATFLANNWTVVNGATNQWFVGAVAVPSAGTNSAYISNDPGGATYNYLNTAASTVHFWRDVTFPAGETNIVLSFRWKCQGEASYDYVTVYSMPTSVTPTVNNPAGAFQSWLNIPTSYPGAVIHASPPNLNLQSAYQTQTICLPAAYAGTTRRLVFMFSNDPSVGTQPPGSVDEISLVSSIASAPTNQPTSLVLTQISTSQINGSFTAAAGAPDGYLTVRYPTGSATTAPVNGTTYTAGTTLGLGRVVSASAATTFNATGLVPATTYDFYVYSYNSATCGGGPLYRTISPLTGTQSTLPCSPLAAGTYTVGPTGTYASLTAVVAALSAGTTGPVIFELQSTYLSTVETFPITFSAVACPLTGGVTIRPQTGAVGLSITSANATGTINFDGGSNITFDGRAGGAGPSQLTISNTALTGYAIQLINSASFNTIRFCTVAGVNNSNTSGVIFFNNAVGLTTGNNNNLITNCDIRDGATNPTNLIYCSGNTIDAASQNMNNTISNNTIHDWFNATSIILSAAINIVGGADNWSITGNSFYQTATRTFTMLTATDQGAIAITSTFGSNFTITGNFIGGSAPLCAGTPWIYTNAVTGTPTAKMIRLTAAIGAFSTISNNTLTNFDITSATTNNLSGLISHVSGNVNITNNTLGSQSATGAVLFTLTNATAGVFYLPLGFGLGAVPCTLNVTNNNIGGITVNNSSTGSISFRVIYGQPVLGNIVNVSNNMIGGTVPNSLQQLSNNIFHGILMLNPTVDGIYSNNTVRNMTLTNAGVTGSVVGINIQTSGGRATITGNTVFNLTTNGTNIAINNAASVVGISMTGSLVGGTNVSGNTIYNLTNTNATVAGWINGMSFATAVLPQPATVVSKNFIHSINLASATGGMAGIISLSVGTAPFQVFNNMIRLGIDASGASITTPLQINGIYKANIGMHAYFNTVYIGGTGVTGAVNTFAYRRTSSGTLDSVMNNIFYNARSNGAGTGRHYAISLNASTAMVSNNNDLFANGTGGVLGINVVTEYATLAAWRTATNLDWSSVSSDPQLLNPGGTAATVDLHINPANPTAVEQGGSPLANVTDDFDTQARAGLTPTDIGADAGNFTLLDQSPPVIMFTALPFTCNTGDRVFAGVTITDATGVPTAGGLRPRIYYRKGAGIYFSQPGTLSSGSGTNGQWSFTIFALDMGGLVATDVVSYYIIAQDNLGNIASNVAGAVATDVNTVTTPPAAPNTYTITGSIVSSGNYTVGAGQTFTTLTLAVAAYNTACLTGPVTFSLMDANFAAETFPITINANPYASAINTLTIRPTLAATTITGLSATGLIVLNGADWININGSINATVNTVCPAVAATRDLTLTNTSTSTTSAVVWLQSTAAFDGATNNSIRNINLLGNLNTQTFVGVGSGSTTISTASLGVGNHNNSFVNNNISRTQYGVFSQGQSLAVKNNGTIINQNLVNTVAPNNTARGGIVTGFENGITISGNNISEIAFTSTPDVFGIALGGIGITTTAFTGNEVTNATVTKNTIGSVRNTGTFSAAGIFVATALSGTNLIANNMISGVSANGTAGDFSVGMLLGGGAGSVTRVYYNTITMTNVNPLTGSSHHSYGLAVGGTTPNPVVDIRNNILVNYQNNGTGNNYAIGYGYIPHTNLTSNNNDYYTAAGATFFIGATGSLSAPTNQSTVANLQAATLKDGAAQNALPVFVSATDLHLSTAAGANWCLNNKGVAVSVTDDIDCQVRNNPPDIGADEFVATGIDIATPAAQTVCSGTLTNIGFSGAAASYTWTRDNTVAVTGIAASGTGNISATLTNTTTSPVTVTFTISPLSAEGCISPSGTFTATVTVNPVHTITLTSAAATTTQTVCINTPIVNITYTLGGGATGATVTGLPGGVSFLVVGTTLTISGSPNTTVGSPFSYSITTTGNSCTVATAGGTITVNPVHTITLTSAAATTTQTVCINTPIVNITYTIGGGATGVTVTGLPGGVSSSLVGTTLTISGSPNTTVGSPFSYSITTTGNSCTVATAGGTITVNAVHTLTLTSAAATTTQTVCINTAIVNITYTIGGGATGVTVTGLPGGVSSSLVGTTLTISGSPNTTVGSPFSYSITTTGNSCTVATAGGTITVTPNNTITLTSGAGTNAQIFCFGPAITNITYATTGATSVTFSGLPPGVSGNWVANVATISGTPTASGLYNYTVTLLGGCGAISASGTIRVNALPVITPTITEPTSCVSADGAISLALVGNGPYTFAWTGSGVNPTSQNQTGLTVGNYTVTVTDVNGCVSSGAYTLLGPGGCFICPTMGSLTTVPSPATCIGSNVVISVSGMTNMGITYGITFKYSTTVLPNPYVGGTTIATVPNAGLTSSKTVATTNTSFAAAGTYYIYSILSPLPIDPACRPSLQVTLVVNPTPTVNPVANQAVCNNSATNPVNFSTPTMGGTAVYNWTNNNTSIGLGASGTGNIPSFNGQNPGTGPNVGTIIVTPAYTNGGATCFGTTTSFTYTVFPTPIVNPVLSQVVCNGALTAAVNFSSPNTGGTVTYNWTNLNAGIGLAANGVGNIPGFIATNPGIIPMVATIVVTPIYTSGTTFCIGPSISFTITVNPTPTVAQPANQTVCHNTSTAAVNFTGTVGGTVYNWTNTNTSIGLAAAGVGNIAAFTAINPGPGVQVATITVTPSYTNAGVTCTGTSRSFTITVNPNNTITIVAGGGPGTITFTGQINPADPSTNFRAFRDGVPKTCAVPGTCTAPLGGTFQYDILSWTNPSPTPQCVTVTYTIPNANPNFSFVTAYNGPVNLANLCANWLGDPGSSVAVGNNIVWSFTAPGAATINFLFTNIVNGQTADYRIVLNYTIPGGGSNVQTVCQGTAIAPIIYNTTWATGATFTGLPPGVTGNWAANVVTISGIPTAAGVFNYTVTLTGGCGIITATGTITVNPKPVMEAPLPVNQTLCNGSSTTPITFNTSLPGVFFTWTNNQPSIGLASAGAGNIPGFIAVNTGTTPVVATVTVIPTTTLGCLGDPVIFTITVNPTNTIVLTAGGTPASTTFTGQINTGDPSTTLRSFRDGVPKTCAVPGTCTPGLAGTFQYDQVTWTNPMPTPQCVTVTYSIPNANPNFSFVTAYNGPVNLANLCTNWLGDPGSSVAVGNTIVWSFTAPGSANITFLFTNIVNGQIADYQIRLDYLQPGGGTNVQAICLGTAITPIIYNTTSATGANFTGLPPGVSGVWAANVITISGTPVVTGVFNYTVTLSGGCGVVTATGTITVNPGANVAAPPNQTLCNGASTAAVNFTGTVAGTTYSWTNNNTSIGLAAGGTGNIPSFTATNTGTTVQTATITVTPTAATCTGTPQSFTITVNPTPTVNAVASQTLCRGASTAAVTFTGAVAGTVYNWINNNPAIGLPASGTGNIASFTAANPFTTPITGTITVTPTFTNDGVSCTGTSQSFSITVNPAANITFTNAPPRVCLTDTIVTLVATPAGGTWSGNGIVGNTFNAALAGLGVHTITYTVAGSSGCVGTGNVNITVNDCIERHNKFAGAVRIYPNPNNGKFRIRFLSDLYKEFNVRIVDAIGQPVSGDYKFSAVRHGDEFEINVPNLPSGYYMLMVYNAQERAAFKFEIIR